MKRFLVIRESGSGFAEIENVYIVEAFTSEEACIRVELTKHYRERIKVYDLETLEDGWSFYK